MSDKILKPTVLALGYFDSVHKGHQQVIKKAREVADELNAQLVVFTFKGNLKAALSGEAEDYYVYSSPEREALIMELGADEIFFAPTEFDFLSLGKLAFLNKMGRRYDVKAYVCGEDYRFGKFGEGSVKDLIKYSSGMNGNGQKVIVVPTVQTEGKKVSTTLIKKLLAAGDIKGANECLTRSYSLTGKIVTGRRMGRELGYPTANLVPDPEKQTLKEGVYKGHATIKGVTYQAVINYGTRPTFKLKDRVIEAHLIGYHGELYGEIITLFFDAYIRDVQKFFSHDQLKAQLQADIDGVLAGKYD